MIVSGDMIHCTPPRCMHLPCTAVLHACAYRNVPGCMHCASSSYVVFHKRMLPFYDGLSCGSISTMYCTADVQPVLAKLGNVHVLFTARDFLSVFSGVYFNAMTLQPAIIWRVSSPAVRPSYDPTPGIMSYVHTHPLLIIPCSEVNDS